MKAILSISFTVHSDNIRVIMSQKLIRVCAQQFHVSLV